MQFTKIQNQAIDFNLDRKGSAWFMPPGAGKTRAWLETINETPGRTLIVAPKMVCMTTWPFERDKWGYEFTMQFQHGPKKTLHGREDVTLINYEAMPWFVEKIKEFRKFPFKYVIFDELSKMKNPDSKRFKAWQRIAHKFKYRSGGTGTPVGNHLKDLWAEMYVCDLGASLGASYKRFEGMYFDKCEYTYQLTPYDGVEDEMMDQMADHAISFNIDDLDLPGVSHIPIMLDLPENVTDYYRELREDGLIEDLDIYAMNAAVKSGKRRQLASGTIINQQKELIYLHDAKAERLKHIVDELQGAPVMSVFEYHHDYEAICKAVGPVPALYGGTKEQDVPRIVKAWNAGKHKHISLHPRSAAHGLNMQDNGNVLIFYTVPWSMELIEQAIGRLRRKGQTAKKILVYYLVVKGTEDERAFLRSQEKYGTHNRIMKGLL